MLLQGFKKKITKIASQFRAFSIMYLIPLFPHSIWSSLAFDSSKISNISSVRSQMRILSWKIWNNCPCLWGKKKLISSLFPSSPQTCKLSPCPFSSHITPLNKSNCYILNSPDQKKTRIKDGILISKLFLRISHGSCCCAPFKIFGSCTGWIQLVRVGEFLKYTVIVDYTNRCVKIFMRNKGRWYFDKKYKIFYYFWSF